MNSEWAKGGKEIELERKRGKKGVRARRKHKLHAIDTVAACFSLIFSFLLLNR